MLRTLIPLALFLCACTVAQDAPAKMSAEEFKTHVDAKANGQKVVLLDVREARELATVGTVKGYTHIPIGSLESRLNELPKDQPIVTFCQLAGRAGKARDMLKQAGYNVVGTAAMKDWNEKGWPVVHPKP